METWKDIPGFEGLYQASDLGRIRRAVHFEDRISKLGLPFKQKVNQRILKGYSYKGKWHLMVNIYKNGKAYMSMVHRLIALTFVPNLNGLECVNHIDGNKFNNTPSNLEWCTRSENILHAYRIGLMDWNKGATHPNAKLKESDIPVIRGLYKLGCTCEQVGSIYSLNRMAIRKIVDRKTWTHV